MQDIEERSRPECVGCHANAVFGTSCLNPIHGFFDWHLGDKGILTFLVLQDPGAGGPNNTGHLCFPCNAEAARRDATARNGLKLWNAVFGADANHYRNSLYQTNAIMHGCDGLTNAQKEEARQACMHVLQQQWDLAQPAVTVAASSLAWRSMEAIMRNQGGWRKDETGVPKGMHVHRHDEDGRVAICTFHPGNRPNKKHVVPCYEKRIFEDLSLTDKMIALIKMDTIQASSHTLAMRVKLRHWIFIADEVRSAEKRMLQRNP